MLSPTPIDRASVFAIQRSGDWLVHLEGNPAKWERAVSLEGALKAMERTLQAPLAVAEIRWFRA